MWLEVDANSEKTVTVFNDKFATTLTAEYDTMSYSDRFNDALREATVWVCEYKKYKNPQQADAGYAQIFDSIVYHDVINRKFVKKNYKLDF